MDPRTKDIYMYLLGVFIVLCAVAVIVLLVFIELPQGNRDLANIALGSLLGMAVNVTSYFFGSSRGSAQKTEALQETTKHLLEQSSGTGNGAGSSESSGAQGSGARATG